MSTWDNPADAPTRGAGARRAELVLVGGKIRTPSHPSGFTQAAAIAGGVIPASSPMIAGGQVVHGSE
jgi:hypothetical protein